MVKDVGRALLAFGVANPVAAVGIAVALAGVLLYIGLAVVEGIAKYAVWAVAAFLAYYVVSSGLLHRAVEYVRENPEQHVWAGAFLIAAGLAFPHVVPPQVYADVQLNISYNLTAGEGLFGFVTATIDPESLRADVDVVDAYGGAPGLHVPKGTPPHSQSPGKGWWVCLSVVSQGHRTGRYCWEVQGVDVLVRAVSGDRQQQGYYISSVPVPGDRGYFEVSVYRDRVRVWQDRIPYVVDDGGPDVSVRSAPAPHPG